MQIALGHVRLAIRDLSSAGAQPFYDSKTRVSVVVNGELYAVDGLREELAGSYNLTSHSDSEIIIPLYLKYGNYFLAKLRGEFSLVLYDGRSQTLLAARDRYGVKPLFWTIVNGRLLLASEAKAFLPLGLSAEWDVPSLLEDGWLHDERTLFRGVRKLRPGHYMTCSSHEYIQHRQYWAMEYPDKRMIEQRTEEEMIAGLRERMLKAVQMRLESDVPVGIYLSGGIDSSILAGMMAELFQKQQSAAVNGSRRRKPVCFTIGFEGREFDESGIARRTAEHLGLEAQVQRMDEEALAAHFADATWHAEHHNPDLNFVGKYLISALSREHGFNVILSGNGADEHFGGYEHYKPDFLREPDLSWASSLQLTKSKRDKLTAIEEENCSPGYAGTDRAFATDEAGIARRMLNDTSISTQLWPVTMAHFASWTRCYGDMSQSLTRANNPDVRTLSLINERWHPLHTAQYLEIKSVLPNLDLTCMGDRMEMAHSVEGRTPYLDHELTSYVNHLPPSLKLKAESDGTMIEKWILREAGRPYLTSEVYGRRKHVFSAPVRFPRNQKLHTMFKSLLTREKVENLGFLETDMVNDLLEEAFDDNGDGNSVKALRLVINVAQWVILSERFNVKKAQAPL